MNDDARTRTKTSDDVASLDPVDPDAATLLGGTESAVAARAPAEDEDRSGETLGRFRLLSRLGQGGMGVVYAAEDTRLGRTVALKILSPEALLREDRRRRFLREARAASAVMHANIAAIFEVGEEDGEVFLAMERVPGQTLRAALNERATPFEAERALEIARDVAKGLREAHAAGIVHRDLKPENVMITPDGAVKILDFGLAKRLGAPDSAPPPSGELATREGQILGTAGYMSPEQALGEAVDARTDLFSLGVILFELLTQTRPFQGENHVAVLFSTYRDPAPPPSSRNPAVSPRVDALVLRCLEKKPAARFQSAAELIDALEAALRPAPPPAPPPAPTGPLPSGEREPLPAWTSALFVAALLLVSIGIAALALRKYAALPADPGAGPAGVAAPPSAGGAATGTNGLPSSGTGTTTESPAASMAVVPAGDTASPSPPGVPRRPCLPGEPGAAVCGDRGAVAWCDPSGRSVGCCGKGLVPKGTDGICVCPPGGTDVPDARRRGCEAVSPEWEASYRKGKSAAMERAIACFKPHTPRKSISDGTFEAEFFLTPEGDVGGARVHLSTMPDDEGQACAIAALRATRFPPPPGEEAGKSLGFGFVFQH